MDNSIIKVVVFDDHKNRREALEFLLNLQPGMVCIGAFKDCNNLINDLRSEVPNVVLMDINMPVTNGIEGVKILRKNYPSVFIIMQTVFDDDDKIFQCLLAGAHGYLLKSATNEKIIQGITEVVEGGVPMTPSIARRVLNYFHQKPQNQNKEKYRLSTRETELLGLLVKGYSHKMISAELFISINTVNNHIKKIYEKLRVHNVSEAVATALKDKLI